MGGGGPGQRGNPSAAGRGGGMEDYWRTARVEGNGDDSVGAKQRSGHDFASEQAAKQFLCCSRVDARNHRFDGGPVLLLRVSVQYSGDHLLNDWVEQNQTGPRERTGPGPGGRGAGALYSVDRTGDRPADFRIECCRARYAAS